MEMLLTTVVFIVATAISIALHVRSRPATSDAPTCARCRARLAVGARSCGQCGLPLQALELVHAPEMARESAADGDVNAACVGCGACVAACPAPGALALRG